MKIAIGNDHTAVEMKRAVADFLCEKGYEEEELGEEGGNDGLSILHDISGREQEERDH